MNNDNAAQQDNAGKPRPFDINKVKVGDEVWFLGPPLSIGRVVDIDLKAGDDAVVVRWSTGSVSTYNVEGRRFTGGCALLALPPLDPLDEIDPSPGNVDKLTRRQVGEGYRIPAHDEEPDSRAEYWQVDDGVCGWHPRYSRPPVDLKSYFGVFTYRVPIAPAMVPLDQSDIVLGRTAVRAKGGVSRLLVVATCPKGLWPAGTTGNTIEWDALRDCYEISFDHGATWQKAEKKGGQAR